MNEADKHKWTPVVIEGDGQTDSTGQVARAQFESLPTGEVGLPISPVDQLQANLANIQEGPFAHEPTIYSLTQAMAHIEHLSRRPEQTEAEYIGETLDDMWAHTETMSQGEAIETVENSAIIFYSGLIDLNTCLEFMDDAYLTPGRKEELVHMLLATGNDYNGRRGGHLPWDDAQTKKAMIDSLSITRKLLAGKADGLRKTSAGQIIDNLQAEILRQVFEIDPNLVADNDRDAWAAIDKKVFDVQRRARKELKAKEDKKAGQEHSSGEVS